MVDFIDADGGEANGGWDAVAKDGGCRVALVGVDEHARDDTVAVEGLSVRRVRVGLSGVGGSIVPAVLCEFLLREGFEIGRV